MTALKPTRLPALMLPLLLIVLLTPCSVAGTIGDDPDGVPSIDAILARYVLAVGGREAILGLRTRTATLRCVTDLPSRTPPVYEVDSLSVWSRASGEFLVVWKTARGTRIEGHDGDELWTIESGGVSTSDNWWGPRDMWLVDPRFPLMLTQHFPNMEVIGLDVWGGEWLYVVGIDGDESHRLGFSVDTGLLTRLGYNRELRDYTEVDGVLVPMRVIESRKGGSSTFIFDAVRHNEEMDPQIFSLAK
jgi:hypothetical protein